MEIEKVAENVWPIPVRKAVNTLIDRLDRNLMVQISNDPDAPYFLQDEDSVYLILPPTIFSGSSGAGGFKCEASGSDIRVYYGTVNTIVPAGMSFGDVPPFLIAPGHTSGVVCLGVIVGTTGPDAGIAQSAEIVTFAAMPADAEPEFYLPLGSFDSSTGSLIVTPGGAGNGVGDQWFELCGLLGGTAQFGPS